MSFQEKIDYHLTYSNRTSKHNSHHNCYKPKNKRNHDETLETDIKSNHIVFLGVCQHLGYIYIDWRCWCSLPKKKNNAKALKSWINALFVTVTNCIHNQEQEQLFSLYLYWRSSMQPHLYPTFIAARHYLENKSTRADA